MNAGWRSLDVLKQSLGDVGEGVTSYLKNRREESERQQNFEQLRGMMGQKGSALENFDPQLLGAMFSGSGYRAAPTLQNVMQYNKGVAPTFTPIGDSRTGIKLMETPSTALGGTGKPTVGDTLIPARPNMQYGWRDRMENGSPATTDVNGTKRYLEEEYARPEDTTEPGTPTGNVRSKSMGSYGMMAGGEGQLAPEQYRALAEAYVASGFTSRPNFPRDPIGQRMFNKATADVLNAMGGGKNAGLLKAEYTSHAGALKKLQERLRVTASYEGAALMNMKVAKAQLAKLPLTSVPSFNRFLNWAQTNWTNNPDVTSAENAVFTAVREYAKVASGSIGSAALTDSAMEEANRLLNTWQTPEQALAALDIMEKDLRNVPKAIQEQIGIEQDALGNLTRSGQSNAVDTTTQKREGGGEGTIRVRRKSDGQTGTIGASKFDPNLYERVQ